jgi:hypothetical protein
MALNNLTEFVGLLSGLIECDHQKYISPKYFRPFCWPEFLPATALSTDWPPIETEGIEKAEIFFVVRSRA